MARKQSDKMILVGSESLGLYTTKRLISEAKKLNHTTSWINPYETLLENKRKSSAIKKVNALYFHRTSGIRYDDFDLLTSLHLQAEGHKVTNPITPLTLFRQKDLQALFFKKHNLLTPDSLSYRGQLTEENWEKIKSISPNRSYILKMVRGNQGIGVNFIEGEKSLRSLLETFHAIKDQRFLIQPFVEHKKEWRLFLIKENILGVIERTLTADDFRGNAKRSKAKFLKKIPSALQKDIELAQMKSGLDYCGIDIMETKEGFSFLEINAVPGFEQMEELSGLNIARELITCLS